MAHFIRLRGPWTIEGEPTPDGRAIVKFSRQFGCSAGLKSAARVCLNIQNVAAPAHVALNGTALGQVVGSAAEIDPDSQRCPAQFDVTALLQPHNTLVIQLETNENSANAQPGEELGLVQLEIE